MRELTFFLGLQVKQKKDGIFISQDKYVAEDPDGEDVDVHTYRSMIGSLMYLTSSRPDIMFAVCACARFQVTPKASHIHAVKQIFRYLKGKPHLGLWYPKDSPFDLVAYSDSDYVGASLDRKSTTGGCQFLGCRLISWQCKKQTVIATSSTEAEYVAAASCCAQCWLSYLTTNGSQFTMSNTHKNWLIQKQTALGKDKSNLLMADNLPKIVWYSIYHITLMKSWLVQKQTALGFNTPRSDEDRIKIMELTVFRLPKIISVGIGVNAAGLKVSVVRHKLLLFSLTNWCCLISVVSLKKKVVITEATIRDALRLDEAEGVDCLPNEEIFAEMARMSYEKSSTKLTFYKAFFSSQWKFLIHTILQSLSAKRTSLNEFSSAMASAVICLSTGRKFSFSKYIFESLVRNVDGSSKFYMYPRFIRLIIHNQLGELEEQGDAEEHVQDDVDDAAAQGADTAVQGNDEALDACAALARRVEHLEYDKVAQALEITKLKRRVKQLERGNKVKVLKQKRLKKVGTSQRIESSDDTDMDDASNQGRMIDELDKDEGIALMDDEGAEKKAEEAQVAGDDQVKGSESVTAASTTIAAAEQQVPATTITAVPSEDKGKGIMVEEPKPMKKKQQVEMDEEYARKLHEELNNDIDWNVAIDHVKQKAKEVPLDYFKGISYDDIRPIFEAKFNSNIEFLLKSKEKLEEEEFRAIQSINETPAQKATKKRKLNEEIEDLK
nr:hypothetical protein [Tanacetum cinerariifolium]